MNNKPFIDKPSLEKLSTGWKKSILTKQKKLPNPQKLQESSAWVITFFKLLILSFFIGFLTKTAGHKLSPDAHLSGLILVFTLLGGLLLGASQAYFNSLIPSILLSSPISSKLLLDSKKTPFYKTCFTTYFVFIALLFINTPEAISWGDNIIFGLLILLTATSIPLLLSFIFSPFKIATISGVTLVALLIISFFPTLQETIYSPLKPYLLFTPLGLILGKVVPNWTYAIMAIASLIIIHRYYQRLFRNFEVNRERQLDELYSIHEDELEEYRDIAESEKIKLNSQQAPSDQISVEHYLQPTSKKDLGYLGQKFQHFLTPRELSILSLSDLTKLFSNLKKLILMLILAVIIPIIDHYITYQIPYFFQIAPLTLTALYAIAPDALALKLLDNQFNLHKSPLTSYYPIGYKELIRLHLKEIAFTSTWKLPLLISVFTIFRYTQNEEHTLTIVHLLFITTLYFTLSYLAVYKYNQSPNIISKIIGVKFLDIILLFTLAIGGVGCIFTLGSVIKGYHPDLLIPLTIALLIISPLLALIHYKSYQSMKLDTLQKTK